MLFSNFERSLIIAVDSANNQLLRCVFDTVMDIINDPDHSKLEKLASMKGSLVYHLQKFSAQYIFSKNYNYEFSQLRHDLKGKVVECLDLKIDDPTDPPKYSMVFRNKKESYLLRKRITFPEDCVKITNEGRWTLSARNLYGLKQRREEHFIDGYNVTSLLNAIGNGDLGAVKRHLDEIDKDGVDIDFENKKVRDTICNAIKQGKRFRTLEFVISNRLEKNPKRTKPGCINDNPRLSSYWDNLELSDQQEVLQTTTATQSVSNDTEVNSDLNNLTLKKEITSHSVIG